MKRWLIVFFSLFILLIGFHLFKRPAAPQIKNFLLITIDTLRADHLGSYGYPRPVSPALDQLAAQGSLFENAFCVMPTTLPSHGSIFFSTWPRIHGSTSNFVLFSNERLVFLPDVLQKHGFEVGALVAAPHLAKHLSGDSAFRNVQVPKREKNAEEMLRSARDWLERNKDKRYFLWIHLWDPHSPYFPHPESLKKLGPVPDTEFPQRFAFLKEPYTQEQIHTMIDLYDNEIAYADRHLGLFLEEFRTKYDNNDTMIIVTSDHGETLDELIGTEGYAFDHGEYLYDHQIRVPLILIQPGAKRGTRISSTVTLLDIMPTVLQAAGIPLPSTAQGNSLLPFLSEKGPPAPPSLVFLQRRDFTSPPRPFLGQHQYGVRERNFKLLWNETDNTTHLFRNGYEGADLAAENERMQTLLRQKLDRWLQLTASFTPESKREVSPEDAEQIRSLGYIQ